MNNTQHNNSIETLVTERLVLRALEENDAKALLNTIGDRETAWWSEWVSHASVDSPLWWSTKKRSIAAAQSTNPLNYSGRMYVEAIEVIATPRYVSYEDHAILSQQMCIPSVEITKCDMDFEKGTVTVKSSEMKMKVNACKKYDTDHGWVVVVYVDLVNGGDKAELVWPEYGKPFFQQITKTDDSVKIARMVLSRKPENPFAGTCG